MDPQEILNRIANCTPETGCELDVQKLAEFLSRATIKPEKGRKWLTKDERSQIAERFRNLLNNEDDSVQKIANDFNVAVWTVYRIGRKETTFDEVDLETRKEIVRLSKDPFMNSGDIADQLELELAVVNKIISGYRGTHPTTPKSDR